MRLLLTSSGLVNDSIVAALGELVERPFAELSLAFVPTAANLEEGDKGWLISDLKKCEDLGFLSIDVVDISALPKGVWQKRLEEADIIFVGGGNTFHLMHWVRASGLQETLPELLKTRVYVGVSAGSMITNPNLQFVSSEKLAAEEIHGEISDTALKFTDFFVEPHIGNPYFPELTFAYVQKEAEDTGATIYALDDESAVVFNDGDARIVSEGKWEKFN